MKSSLLSQAGVTHQVFGRPYNFRYQTQQEHLARDVRRALAVLGELPDMIYSGEQCHGNQIAYADGMSGESFIIGRQFSETDGLITDKPGVALMIKFADCTPLVFYDPVQQVLACVHSGWRGTVQHIAANAVERMTRDFGCVLSDILVYVGPSIDQAHYEVGPEVYDAFASVGSREQYFQHQGDKYCLSMVDANVAILRQLGFQSSQLDICRASTVTDPTLHSARQEGPAYGLNALIAMLPTI